MQHRAGGGSFESGELEVHLWFPLSPPCDYRLLTLRLWAIVAYNNVR